MTVGADENNQQDAEDEGTAIARSSFCTKPFSGNHPEHGIVRSNVGLDSMFAEIERAEAREDIPDGDLNYNRNQRRKHMGNSVSAIITETGPITVDADGKPVAEHLNTISAAENTYAGRPRSDIIPYGPPTYGQRQIKVPTRRQSVTENQEKGQMKRKRESVAETKPVVPEWKPERQILTASQVDDEVSYKSEGSIELRIDRFAEFVRSEEERYSAPTYIRGLSWEIKAYCEEIDKSNNSDGQSPSKGLSVYLWCQRDSTNRTWECHANYSLRVMAQKEGVKDISQEDLEDAFYGMDYWGIHTETCVFLLDPKNGYIKDDTVILQAHVKPITVKTLSGTLAIESYKQLFSSSTQYSWDFVVVIQDEEVHVQKGLLAIHSEYFKDQFAKYEENNSAVLQDVDYEEFIELLSVIYPTFYPITADNVETISKLAFKFNMAGLLRQCEIFLMKKNKEFGRAKSLLIAEWYGLEQLTGNIIYEIQNITDIKDMKPEYDMLSDRTKRMLFDRICTTGPASNPKPENVDTTIDRATEILQELASSACTPSDDVLIVENNRIPIHKAYLAVNSKYFTAMFQGQFAEKDKDEFVLEEIGYNEILELLTVIYPTASPITEKNIGVILKMADRFIMPAILVRCKKFLQDSMQISAARKLWLAQRYNLPDLRDEFAKNCKTMSHIELLKAGPEFGLLNDKTRALILDSVSF